MSNYVEQWFKIMNYQISDSKRRNRIQNAQLRKLVDFSRKNSPFISEYYTNIPDSFVLSDLPVVSKKIIMENYDRYTTDRAVTLDVVKEYMADKNNAYGKKFLFDKYVLLPTSGSTGEPGLILADSSCMLNISVSAFVNYMKMHFPVASLCIDDGFGIDNLAVKYNAKNFVDSDSFFRNIDLSRPSSEILEELNSFKPRMMFGYPSSFAFLADYVKGKLKYKPYQIGLSGEVLNDSTRNYLKQVFGCDVRSFYACTEGGVIAYECKYHHLHIISNSVIIEPVDKDNNPVENGVISDKVLLTNLSNYIMPLIRYEMNDRIRYVDEDCECGKHGWIEVSGRASEVLTFEDENGNRTINISGMLLHDILDVLYGGTIGRFQFILHPKNELEFRFVSDITAIRNRTELFEKINTKLMTYFSENGIGNVKFFLSDEEPQIDEKTHKLRHFINLDY